MPRMAAAVARLEAASGMAGGRVASSLSANPAGSADGDASLLASVIAFDEVGGATDHLFALELRIAADLPRMANGGLGAVPLCCAAC